MGTEKKEKRKYEFHGKEYERKEYVRLVRAEKKEKLRKYREEHGIEAPGVKNFDLNNEKVWFKNTYRQVKVQLVNGFVKRMRYFRHTLEKLNQTDTSTLEEKARNTVEAKKRRCVNGEKHKEKEMYLIKSWDSNQVFNMLIENEPIEFIKASQMTDETGDFTFRARERIRTHPLVKPVWEKINRNLNLFEEDRTQEGKSKSKKLASEVFGKATVKTETKEVTEDLSEADKTDNVKTEKTEEDGKSEKGVKTEDKKETNESRFNMDKFKKLEEKANTQDKDEEEKMETEEIEDFNEYSSDEENDGEDDDDNDEGNDAGEISENEDGGYDIEFVMPKFISEKPKTKKEEKKSKKSKEGKAKPEEEINDFFINEGEDYNQSDEENNLKIDEGSSSEEEEGGKNDGFFLENDKVVKLKKNVKSETSKKKTNKDNREGQRERKKHSKAVYGKHVEVVEKQEKKFRERNKKRKGEKKVVEEEKKEELHPSWAASKKAKVENKIHKFEGKKVTFDSDSE